MHTGVYPGSFDPVTYGHIDIIERARVLFDHLVIAVAENTNKTPLFSLEERLALMRDIFKDKPNLEVRSFSGLLVNFVKDVNAGAIVRGIRAVTDFDYEYAIYQINRDLNPEIDTIFLLAGKKYSFLSSSIIKEVARYGRRVDEYTPTSVSAALLRKFGHKI